MIKILNCDFILNMKQRKHPMKYSLTIHDLNASQVTDLMNSVENKTEITSVHQTTNVVNNVPPIGSPESIAAANTLLNATTDELLKSASTPGDVDCENLPWDGRIHSGSKKKNSDGKWKLLKNVDADLVTAVKAELIAGRPAMVGVVPPVVPPFLPREAPPVVQPVSAPAIAPATFVAPVLPVAAPIARDFQGLMLQISKLFAAKQITPDYPNTIVARVNDGFKSGIVTLTDVQNDPRMVEYSWQCLEVDGKAS